MIKNIMNNIGRKEAAGNYGKLIDRRDELFEKRDELFRKGKKLSPEEADEIRDLNEKIQHYLFSTLKGTKGSNPAIDKKKFVEMVYDYGASGDKTLEGLNENQKQAIASAWSTFKAEDEEGETDEKFGSFYSDFLGK